MFDLLGVGLCIACISYLCCIYTTAFVTFGGPFEKRKNHRQGRYRRAKRRPIAVYPKETTASPLDSSPRGSSTRHGCPCATVHQPFNTDCSANPSRRKLYLVTASFLDFDDTSVDDCGKCQRSDNGSCYCPASDKHSFANFPRRRESRLSKCRA